MDSFEKAKINEEVLKQFEDIWHGAYKAGYIQGKSEGLELGGKIARESFDNAINQVFNKTK